MLHEQISKAGQASQRKFIFAFVALAGIVLIGLVVVFAPDIRSGVQSATSLGTAPVEARLDRTISQPSTEPDPAQANLLRDDFKARLDAFQTDIEPQVSSAGFEAWNASAKRDLTDAKPKAISQFMAGDYQAGLQTIDNAIEQGKALIANWNEAIADQLQAAQEAFEEDDYQKAKSRIDKAAQMAPDDAQVMALRDAIEALPDFLQAYDLARIARAEGNLDKEYAALSEAIKLAPDRAKVIERLSVLEDRIQERNFSQSIQKGLDALAGRDLSTAKQALKMAEELGNDRPETKLLKQNVAELARDIRVQYLKAEAEKAVSRDDWKTAARHFKEALKVRAVDQELASGKALAEAILTASGNLNSDISQPHRLSAPNIRKQAQDHIDQARRLGVHSQSLRAKTQQLAKLVEIYTTTLPVRVLSDQQTHVRVLGVGIVGIVLEKVIQLSPGDYRFEGVKDGFRAKIVPVTVKPGDQGTTVEVICDEPI